MLGTDLQCPGTAEKRNVLVVAGVLLPRRLVELETLFLRLVQHAGHTVWLGQATLPASLERGRGLNRNSLVFEVAFTSFEVVSYTLQSCPGSILPCRYMVGCSVQHSSV